MKLRKDVLYIQINMIHLPMFYGYFTFWFLRHYGFNLFMLYYQNLTNIRPGRFKDAFRLFFMAPFTAWNLTMQSFREVWYTVYDMYCKLSESTGFRTMTGLSVLQEQPKVYNP